ncbi:MAG TPA: hypothetical protein DEA55_00845, partial [Rhodospirillaceae bacterium]|nr:hypothetical protein [Rhodospirillaceae bacterium]
MGFTPEQLRTYSYISNATLAVNGLLKELYERREEVETPASERDDIASWIVDLESKFIDLNRLERQFIDEPDRLRPPSQEAVDAVVELARQVDAAIEADARTRNLLGLAREIVSLVNETKLARAAAAPDTGAQRDAAGEGGSQ